MIKTKKQIFIIIQVFVLIMLLGVVTYAYFNYTRTGSLNNLGTGTINFSSNQGDSLNLTNLFAMSSIEASNANLDEINITIEGDTTYADGEEFVISFDDVENIVGGKTIPITYIATYEENENKTIGDSSNNYYTARNSKNANIYSLSSTGTIKNGEKILVGYIKSGNTGIDGTLSVKAYIDSSNVAISDTYTQIHEGDYFVNKNMTAAEINNCVSYITSLGINNYAYAWESLESFCQGTGTLQGHSFQAALDTNSFNQNAKNHLASINAIIKSNYTDGTTSEWVNGRVVLTTSEWNSIGTDPISFKIKVESNEGIWLEEPSSRNDMVNFSVDINTHQTIETYITKQQKFNITEINFIKLSESEINKHSNLIDLTESGGSGVVKAWIENNILYIASPGDIYFPEISNFLFRDFSNVKRINFNNINTSEIHHMEGMFYSCTSIDYIDLSGFDTTNLDCCLDYMFYDCLNLVTVNFGNFDASRVKDMSYMFYRCKKLTELDLSNFSTNYAENMQYMFSECSNLLTLDLSSFVTSNVTVMDGMFYDCSSLKSINVSSFNTSNVVSMSTMFSNCVSLISLDLSSFNTPKATNMASMFYKCSSLTSLDISNFDVHLVTNMAAFVALCSKLTSIDLSSFNTSSLDICSGMFAECASLRTILVSNNWNITNASISTSMFISSTSLVGGQGTVYDANYVDKTYAHIDGGQSNPGYLTLKTN